MKTRSGASKQASPKEVARKSRDRSEVRVVSAEFVAAGISHSNLPGSQYTEIAMAGRSNVGKSSLINALLGRSKLARKSSTPGCTRSLNLYHTELILGDDRRAMLDVVDLPGYGYAERSKAERVAWGQMIEGFLENRASLVLVLHIVDARRGIEPTDLELIRYLEHIGRGVEIVATKIDKLSASERGVALARIRKACGRTPRVWSSETLEGRAELWTDLSRVLFGKQALEADASVAESVSEGAGEDNLS